MPKFLSAALLALVLVASGCGGSDSGSDAGAGAEATETESSAGESTLAAVESSGVVRIGVRNDNPPMSFLDDEGEWIGFDLELAQAIADELGAKLELVPVDGTTRIGFLESGQVDLSVASMNHTRSREESIDFSITYFWDNQSFLVRTGSYASIDELIDQKVAASAGSSVIDSWTNYAAAAGGDAPEIVEFEDKLAAVQAVLDGAVEGYSEDNITLLSLAAGNPDLTLLPGGHNRVQFGIGVPENDSDWSDAVNVAVQEVWKSGEYQRIYDRWFVTPDTRIIELPLGGAMEIWN